MEVGWGEWEMETNRIHPTHVWNSQRIRFQLHVLLKKPLAYERFLFNVGQEKREYLAFLAQTVEVNLSVLSCIPLQVLGSHPPSSRAQHRNPPKSPTPKLPSVLGLYPTPAATDVHLVLEGSQLYEFSQSLLIIDFFSKKRLMGQNKFLTCAIFKTL